MKYFLLTASVFLGALKSVFTKISKTKNTTLYEMSKINLISFSCALAVVLLFSMGTLSEPFSVPVIIAFFYAVCTFASQLCLMKAVELGSVSVSSLFYSCGFIIPTVWGNIRYHEGIGILHIFGLSAIAISFFLSSKLSKEKQFSWRWLIVALGGTLFSGLVGIIQKLFTNEYTQYSLDYFLITAFSFILIANSVLYVACRLHRNATRNGNKTESGGKDGSWNGKIVLYSVVLGVIIGFVNKINTYLSGVFSSIIAFPVINGGAILLAALFSRIIFKEKLTHIQWTGIAVGVIGIVLLSLGQTMI